MLNLFKEDFLYDEKKVVRNWKAVSDEDIKKSFVEKFKKFQDNLDLIKEPIYFSTIEYVFMSLEDLDLLRQKFT